MSMRQEKTIVISTLALVVMTACAAKTNVEDGIVSSATAEKPISNGYLKPGAAVNYSHNLPANVKANEAVTFQLTLQESYNQGTLNVNIMGEGGVQTLAVSSGFSFDMASGTSHDMDVSFTANTNGRHYINVQAEAIDDSGNSKPRIFSIPVQVGPPIAQKPNPNMKTMDDGKNVIEMEAEEEIIYK